MENGFDERAIQVNQEAHVHWPDHAGITLSLFYMGCFVPDITVPLNDVRRAIITARGDAATTVNVLQSLVKDRHSGLCPRYSVPDLQELTRTTLSSPTMVSNQFHAVLHHVNATLSEMAGNMEEGLSHLDQTIELDPKITILTQAIVWSLNLRDPQRAHRYLEMAESSPRIGVVERWTFRKEIAGNRQLIELYESIEAESSN